eukprot:scaffold6585_cov403-Prasinococcus_capsulatus_cf.AAC.3
MTCTGLRGLECKSVVEANRIPLATWDAHGCSLAPYRQKTSPKDSRVTFAQQHYLQHGPLLPPSKSADCVPRRGVKVMEARLAWIEGRTKSIHTQ